MQVAVEDSARAAAEEAEHGLCQCVREGCGGGGLWKKNRSLVLIETDGNTTAAGSYF